MSSELRRTVGGDAPATDFTVRSRGDRPRPEAEGRGAARIGADLLELIARLEESLAEAWQEIQDLRDKVSALSPAPGPITVEQLVQRHPALTPGGIRWMLFHRDTNGLQKSGAIITRGRRLYLDEVRFLAWFASAGKTKARLQPSRRRE